MAFPWLEQAWTPKRFPRLVVLQSGFLPQEDYIYRSFNFNKIRTLEVEDLCEVVFFFSVEQQFFDIFRIFKFGFVYLELLGSFHST